MQRFCENLSRGEAIEDLDPGGSGVGTGGVTGRTFRCRLAAQEAVFANCLGGPEALLEVRAAARPELIRIGRHIVADGLQNEA